MPHRQEPTPAAEQRDTVSDARDAAADKRENDLDRARLLAPPETYGYGDDWPKRHNAGLYRAHSTDDRAASHNDRIHLTQEGDEDDPSHT
jgi:hypothetical protein